MIRAAAAGRINEKNPAAPLFLLVFFMEEVLQLLPGRF